MTTILRVQLWKAWCEQPQHSSLNEVDQLYYMGAMNNGAKDNTAAILVGDPTKVKTADDKFEPLTMTKDTVVDFPQQAATMFQSTLQVNEDDQVGIAIGGYSQSLSHQWAPYIKLGEDVTAAAGNVMANQKGALQWVGQLLKELPKLITDVTNLDQDTLLGWFEQTIYVPDLQPGIAFSRTPMTNGGHYDTWIRVTRDDRDYRAIATALQYPTVAVACGQPSPTPARVTLHNVGRQTFTHAQTYLTTVQYDLSDPFLLTNIREIPNDWFQPVALAQDAPPGQDFSFDIPLQAPSQAGPETLKLALRVDDPIGLVPLETPSQMVLTAGGVMTLTATVVAHHPILHGEASQLRFSAVDKTSLAPIAPSELTVLADGNPVGDGTGLYWQSGQTVGRPPNLNTVITPTFQVVAPNYLPAEYEPLGGM
jgi:hypothetical protein